MLWRLRKAKTFFRVSLVLNIVIVVYICINRSTSRSTISELSARDLPYLGRKELPSTQVERRVVTTPPLRSNTSTPTDIIERPKPKTQPPKCYKRFLLFGLRQHWFEFCSFEEFSQYKYLISFPRVLHCPIVDCYVILSYSLEAKDIPGNDVVLFTDVYQWLTPEMWDWAYGNRTEGQSWVMITEESPLYGPGVQPPNKYADSVFDFIDSYKTDSDFVHPYGYYKVYQGQAPTKFDTAALLASKSKFLAWMGSHCETLQWNRQLFVDDIGGVVRIDKYGKCGDTEIPWNNFQALKEILTPYKFYLSLENSCCEDYVTEKFWRTLELGLVPIVVGAPYDHYLKVAPPHSFIHPDQFDSLEEMALHLVQVNANQEKYLEYFKWKNMGELVSHGQEEHYVRPLTNQTQCDILEKHVKLTDIPHKKRDFFGQEWYGSCVQCGTKPWMQKYMLDRNSARANKDIWA